MERRVALRAKRVFVLLTVFLFHWCAVGTLAHVLLAGSALQVPCLIA
jgi:hypothetical protein